MTFLKTNRLLMVGYAPKSNLNFWLIRLNLVALDYPRTIEFTMGLLGFGLLLKFDYWVADIDFTKREANTSANPSGSIDNE